MVGIALTVCGRGRGYKVVFGGSCCHCSAVLRLEFAFVIGACAGICFFLMSLVTWFLLISSPYWDAVLEMMSYPALCCGNRHMVYSDQYAARAYR